MSKNSKAQKVQNTEATELPEVKKVTTSEFNVKNFSVDPFKIQKDALQLSAYCRYDFGSSGKKKVSGTEKAENMSTKDRCIIVTKPIKIARGGIPSHHEKWRPNDNSRLYFWLNLDQCDGGKDFRDNVLKPLDKLFDEKINKEQNKNFLQQMTADGSVKALKNLKFGPSVKMSPTGDDDDQKSTLPPYERTKVKLATVYEENAPAEKPQQIKTKVFVDGVEGALKIDSLDKLVEQFPWGCTAEFAIEINKVWAAKSGNERGCGYGLKCLAIHVISKPKTATQAQVNASIFGGMSTSKSQEENNDEETNNGSDDDKSDSDKSDDEDTKKQSNKNNKKQAQKEDSDSESDDDEDDKKSVTSEKSEKSEKSEHSDSGSDSESEDEKPAKNNKKTNKKEAEAPTKQDKKGSSKQTKKNDSDSDSESGSDSDSASESEDEKNKKSNKKTNKKEPVKDSKKKK